jgi:hypothetical protein
LDIMHASTQLTSRQASENSSIFLLLLIVAIILAMAALRAAISVLWAPTNHLLRGLWSAVKAPLLLFLALICMILFVFSGREDTTEPTNRFPPVGVSQPASLSGSRTSAAARRAERQGGAVCQGAIPGASGADGGCCAGARITGRRCAL